MTTASTPAPAAHTQAASGSTRYRGSVAYIFAYDLAYDMAEKPVVQLLGQSVRQFSTEISKHAPKDLFFYRPQMIDLPPIQKVGPHGPITLERTVKLFPVGAISISVHLPFAVESINDLVKYHELQLDDGSLHDQVLQLAQEVRQELEPYCVRPVNRVKNEEAYTVFCFEPPFFSADGRPVPAEEWHAENRRLLAALLTQESNAANLSHQEATESTGKYLSYYDSDVCVIDWDAAILADKAENFAEVLHIMELANVQLAELEAYDRALDDTLQQSYRDLGRRSLAGRQDVLSTLRTIRIDLARLSDELSNTTKFFGDWHLARIYQALSDRFHLSDWQRVISEKLRTLDNLYQLLKQDQTNRWMMILEATIVLLFIIDLVILLLPGRGK